MRAASRLGLALTLVVLGSAGKKAGPPVAAPGTVEARARSPLRCSTFTFDPAAGGLEEGNVGGCDLRPSFFLSRQGWVEVPFPTPRDTDVRRRVRRVDEGEVLRRQIALADPSGMQLWSAKIEGESLPWAPSGRCAAPAPGEPLSLLDLGAWRFVVVQVVTRGPYGGLRPWLGTGDHDAMHLLGLTGGDGKSIDGRSVTASRESSGLWVISWCAEGFGAPFTLELLLNDISMKEPTKLVLPASVEADSFTFLNLVVDSAAP